LQLFQTYGIGQLAIHCALRPDLLTDNAWLEQSWKEVAPDIFSGDHAIQSYEQFTGNEFPDHARGKFISTVNLINQLYLYSQKSPGAVKAQKRLAEMAEMAMGLVTNGIDDTADRITAAAAYVQKQANALTEHADRELDKLTVKLAALRAKLDAERAAKKSKMDSDTRR
jgi:hypothetical protein